MGLLGPLACGKMFRCYGKASAFPAMGLVLEQPLIRKELTGIVFSLARKGCSRQGHCQVQSMAFPNLGGMK